jgi:hypothetical protein
LDERPALRLEEPAVAAIEEDAVGLLIFFFMTLLSLATVVVQGGQDLREVSFV